MKLLEIFRNNDGAGTRLELAQAFADLGDPELARDYLDEVIASGNETDRETALSMIRSLPEVAQVA